MKTEVNLKHILYNIVRQTNVVQYIYVQYTYALLFKFILF